MTKVKIIAVALCFAVALFATGAVSAAGVSTASLFHGSADETVAASDNTGLGMLFDARTGGNTWAGAEVYFYADNLGLSAKAGTGIGPVQLSAGLGMFNDSLRDTVDVAGVDVTDTAGSESRTAFVEASMGHFFVRISRIESDFTLRASRQTGVDGLGNPVYTSASRDVSTSDDWLWVGVRFGI